MKLIVKHGLVILVRNVAIFIGIVHMEKTNLFDTVEYLLELVRHLKDNDTCRRAGTCADVPVDFQHRSKLLCSSFVADFYTSPAHSI